MTRATKPAATLPTLRDYRLKTGKTQEALAAELGIDQATISRIEHGRGCSLSMAAAIVKATGVEWTSLVPAAKE